MDKLFLLQVRGTLFEVMADTVEELQRKAAALRDRQKLSGKTYRIWVGTKPAGSDAQFSFGPIAKEAVFS
jgi:hypothetical protein